MRQKQHDPTDTETPQANPGYALLQIANALLTSEQHTDPATRERAKQKIAQWQTVFTQMLDGSLNIGSRQPLANVPTWATLEVLKGGFASGALLAAGPLLDHEHRLLQAIATEPSDTARYTLNTYYLTEAGLQQLQAMLVSGCYEIKIPEEGALLVVAWLLQHHYADEARALLQTLAPFFSRLRFYPIPVKQPRFFGSQVYVQDVRSTLEVLKHIQPNRQILAQKEAIQIWNPLYDWCVALFLETVAGDVPTFTDNCSSPIVGGWPCQHYSDTWRTHAQRLLQKYAAMRTVHTLCGKPERLRDNFAQLRAYLRRCIDKPQDLSGRDVGRIRRILAEYILKRGTPTSPQCLAVRAEQAEHTRAPAFSDIAPILVARLKHYPYDCGIENLEPVTQPITAEEAAQSTVMEGTSIPSALQRKLSRCLCDTTHVLVERGIITSGETLA